MNDLHLSPDAQDDLSEIKAYIAEDLENPQAAISTVAKITKTVRVLRDHAYIGTPLSSISNVSSDYRYLVSGSYMVFYRIAGTDIFIDRVLYGRSDYRNILFKDMLSDETEIITTGRAGGLHRPPWGLLPAEPIGSSNLLSTA